MAFIDDVIKRVRDYDAARPRSRQAAVGWSEVGGCRAALGFRLDGAWESDETDTWAAQRGTAIHEYLGPILAGPGVRIEVDTEYRGIPGHADIVEPDAIDDIKTTSLANSKLWADDHSLLRPKRIQVHGYAAGLVDAGELPADCTVRLLVIPVDGTFADWWAYEEPFDRSLADEGADRLEEVRERMAAGETLPKDKPYAWCETWCLAPETEIVTRDGIRPIGDIAGTVQQLLVPSDGHGGVWQECKVRSYGVQPLMAVNLRRGKATKVIYATEGHRWITEGGSPVQTGELRPKMRLRSIRRKAGPSAEVPFAVAQGFVYGDGGATTHNRDSAASVNFYPNSPKWESMAPYFTGHRVTEFADGSRAIRMVPRSWKQAPDLGESRAFLLSWLAGYIAADGSVSPDGQTTVSSARRESVDLVRSICAIVGIGYSDVTVHSRIGIHQTEPTDLFGVTISTRDVPEWVFKHEHHRARAAQARRRKQYSRAWVVDSIEKTDRVEEVFCAEVPGTEAFALTEELLTHNCSFFSLCRDTGQPDGEIITDAELAAAVERYGAINAQIRPLEQAKKSLAPVVRGLRGITPGGWKVGLSEAGEAGVKLDEARVRSDYEAWGVDLPEVSKPGAAPKLLVRRIKTTANGSSKEAAA